ncbi:MAG: hypothetical protein R3Y45_02425 [Bacillota bacterium]
MAEREIKRKLISTFETVDNQKVEVFSLVTEDFDLVFGFYESEIARLANKADFYPYKDSEIKSILSGGGVFLGGFIGGELCGLCAIDFDSEYQVGVKKVNENFPSFPFEDDILEFSGLFVAEKFRKLGISSKMSDVLLQVAGEVRKNSRLFAVVLESNIPSMKNFFSKGFKLYGWWQMNEEYKFVYLISQKAGEKSGASGTERVNVENIVEALKCGSVFCGVDGKGRFLR